MRYLFSTYGVVLGVLSTLLILDVGCSQHEAPPPTSQINEQQRLEFTRMIVHRQKYTEPGYLEFVDDVKPEVAQVGFYGNDFYAMAHLDEHGKGLTGTVLPTHAGAIPMATGKAGMEANLEFFANINAELRKRNVKAIGHFGVSKFMMGIPDDPENPTGGFFEFYRDLWDEEAFGPKPVDDPMALVQRNADGSPIIHHDSDAKPYGVYYGCLNNPHWRNVLKAFVKRGIDAGVDGFVINYLYRNNCVCEHCRRAFKKHLAGRYTPSQLRVEFGIDDLEAHRFSEIVSRHDPQETTPLRLEMLRFSDLTNKEAYDEVFLDYGRSLKPDLIASTWLHLYGFLYPQTGWTDERALLPAELWSKGEDYLWYCVGGYFSKTDLAKGELGETTLQMRYIRGASGDKPYTVCKYETTRVRSSMAELAANGGASMAMHNDFTDADARREFVHYHGFLRENQEVYHANRPHGEAVVLFPRKHLHEGKFGKSMAAFREVAFRLLDEHVLFDVLPDDIATPEMLSAYRRVYTISSRYSMTDEALEGFSRFQAPKTVRVSASRPTVGNEITVHFVNYHRKEPDGAARGAQHERPIASPAIEASVVLPQGASASRVEWLTPEEPEVLEVPSESADGRVTFSTPEFLVYGVARIHLASGG